MFNPEIDRLLRCDRLAGPADLVINRQGENTRGEHVGEWDWFHQLTPSDQRMIRSDCFGGTLELDVAARDNAMTCEQLGDALLDACRVIRDRETVSCHDDRVRIDDLVGPDEVCELLQVERNTLVQWRRRPAVRFPDPLFTLSKMDVWARADVEKWAIDTGRLTVGGETF